MTVLRWLLLILYVGVLAAYAVPTFLSLTHPDGPGALLLLVGFVGLQATFIMSAGTRQLCRPVPLRRLLFPMLLTATSLMLLALAASMAMLEAADVQPDWGDWSLVIIISAAVIIWVTTLAVLFHLAAGRERRSALWRLCAALIIGCIVELVVAWSSFALAQNNGGFLAGIVSMLAIMLGFLTLAWIVGPCIVFLFLRPRYRRERADWETHCQTCGYDLRVQLAAGGSADRCPECGTSIAK